jgi:hypothetical protein
MAAESYRASEDYHDAQLDEGVAISEKVMFQRRDARCPTMSKQFTKNEEYVAKLRAAGFSDVEVEPWRIYKLEDGRAFLTENGIDVDRLTPDVNGKFASAFVRDTSRCSSSRLRK